MADLRKLKDRAAELLTKGKPDKAAEILRQVLAADAKDIAARQKLAELLRRAGQGQDAIANYRQVADRYAHDGFLIKAIAISKIILEIDPSHSETQADLARLYARRNGPGAEASQTPSPAGPVLVPPYVEPPKDDGGIELPPEEASAPPLEIESLSASRAGEPRDPSEEPASELPAELQAPDPAQAPAPIPLTQVVARAPAAERDPFAGPQPSRRSAPATTAYEAILSAAAEAAGSGMEDEVIIEGEPVEEIEPEEFLDEPRPQADGPLPQAPRSGRRLPHIPLFSDLGPRPFVALAERSVLRDVKAGQVIVREGESGSSFFVIATGRFRVEKRNAAGDSVVLAHLGEGSFFGEMALLSGAPRAAAVTAEVDGQLLEITAELLQELCREHPQVAQSLTRFYRQRLLANAMATSPLFGPFDKERRKELMEKFRTREVRAGEVILREGRPSDGLYVVLSGEVQVRKQRGGTEVLAGLLGACDVFGEVSCLRKGPATATVAATRDGILLRLPREAFDEIITGYPQVLEMVSQLTDERMQSLDAIVSGRAEFTGDGLVLI